MVRARGGADHPGRLSVERWQSDLDCLVELVRLRASPSDAHSEVLWNFAEAKGILGWSESIPMRSYRLRDGWYVNTARDSRLERLGARLTGIDDLPIEDLLERIKPYAVGDNDINRRPPPGEPCSPGRNSCTNLTWWGSLTNRAINLSLRVEATWRRPGLLYIAPY